MNKPIRSDSPNKTTEDLLNDGWVFLDKKYENLVKGIITVLRAALDREYWNKNQKEMCSPFDNSGATDFVTDYLIIRSYNWDGNYLPNLDTDKLKVFWYKHSNRGLEVMIRPESYSSLVDILADVVNKSVESVEDSFRMKGDA